LRAASDASITTLLSSLSSSSSMPTDVLLAQIAAGTSSKAVTTHALS
jgi:hypothetical protein